MPFSRRPVIFPVDVDDRRGAREARRLDEEAVIGPRSCTCPVHVVSHGGIAIKVGVATPSRNTRVTHAFASRQERRRHVRPSSSLSPSWVDARDNSSESYAVATAR